MVTPHDCESNPTCKLFFEFWEGIVGRYPVSRAGDVVVRMFVRECIANMYTHYFSGVTQRAWSHMLPSFAPHPFTERYYVVPMAVAPPQHSLHPLDRRAAAPLHPLSLTSLVHRQGPHLLRPLRLIKSRRHQTRPHVRARRAPPLLHRVVPRATT